jgi:hypothetical protein
MKKPTDQMFFDNNEDSAKRKPFLTALEIQKKKQAKLDDDTSVSIGKLEKSISRAHFIVGELVLKNPELFALIKPEVDSHLDKESSAYNVVQEYTDTQRVHSDMDLRNLAFFVSVVAGMPATFRSRLHRTTIDYCSIPTIF